jgi:hypothetical protein
VESKCTQCGLLDFIRSGNVCDECCDFETKRRENRKELVVKALLEAEKIAFRHDLRPEDGCGRARPDFVIDCGTHIVIIEVDEHQHRKSSYDCRCEQVRTINLFQEFGGLSVVFIRYNPDGYTGHDGRKGKGNSAPNEARLMRLVHYSIDKLPASQLCVRYVCFDGDNGTFEEHAVDIDEHVLRSE